VLVRIVASQRLDPVRPEDDEDSETAAEAGEYSDQRNRHVISVRLRVSSRALPTPDVLINHISTRLQSPGCGANAQTWATLDVEARRKRPIRANGPQSINWEPPSSGVPLTGYRPPAQTIINIAAMRTTEPANPENLKLTKLDAARRQLHTAIILWFTDGDPVSIYTLTAAAHEIIHTVTIEHIQNRRPLLFDSDHLTADGRKIIRNAMKKPANFFKHADTDSEETLDFNPVASEYLIIYSILGLWTHDTTPKFFELAFMMYLLLNRRITLSDEGQKFIIANFPVEILEEIKSLSKEDYFELYRLHVKIS
jgi:hypothetical protein